MTPPTHIKAWLKGQPASVLRKVIDRCDNLLIELKTTFEAEGPPGSIARRSGAVTLKQQSIRCSKWCKRCSLRPYWYAYWCSGRRSHSAYIGKDINAAAAVLADKPGVDPSRWHIITPEE